MWWRRTRSGREDAAPEVTGSGPDQAHARAPGVGGLEPVRDRHEFDAGLAQPFFQRRENIRLFDFQREPGEAGGGLVAAAGAGALPDIQPEMVVIAAGGQECGAIARARRIEAEGATVKPVGF